MTSRDLDPSPVKTYNYVCFKTYFVNLSFDRKSLGDRLFLEMSKIYIEIIACNGYFLPFFSLIDNIFEMRCTSAIKLSPSLGNIQG